jgi:hypothetical protein
MNIQETIDEILALMSVPNWRGVYVLGCFAAQLPLLDWAADYADAVAERVTRKWDTRAWNGHRLRVRSIPLTKACVAASRVLREVPQRVHVLSASGAGDSDRGQRLY